MTKVALKSSFDTKTHFQAKITSKPFSPFQFLNFSPTQDFNKNSMFENTALLEKEYLVDFNPDKGTTDLTVTLRSGSRGPTDPI